MRVVKPVRRSFGFTLVELMVTIAVLVVAMSIVAPSLASFAANNQVVTAKSTFGSALTYARTEAARRGQTVIVQAISGGGSGNAYGAGWELYVDTDGDGSVGNGDELLRRYSALNSKIKLDGATPLSFLASGFLSGTTAQDYTVCRKSGSTAGYKITVTPTGLPDVSAITSC